MKSPLSTKPSTGLSTGARSAPSPAAVPTCDALPPGTHLEQFEIERMLGASGFGIVYLAFDPKSGRRVALKEYLPVTLALRADDGVQVLLRAPNHAAAFERGRRAFLDEAQLLARCDHPSLLRVLRSWEANGTVYRAMPYYPGSTLLTLRQSMDQPPDEASLRSLLDELLGALEVLHKEGRVHREISPGNIVLLPDDRPVLLDFGAARRAIVGEQAQALMTLVEPTFAPIEQIGTAPGAPMGPWTDLYALAATLHFCISGRLPAAPSGWKPEPLEPLADVVQRLIRLYPFVHYGPSFLAAIDAALAVQPQDRPQSVQEFRAALGTPAAPSAERIEPVLAPEPAAPRPAPSHASSMAPTEGDPVPWPRSTARPERFTLPPEPAGIPEASTSPDATVPFSAAVLPSPPQPVAAPADPAFSFDAMGATESMFQPGPAAAPAAAESPDSPPSWHYEEPPQVSAPRSRPQHVGAWLAGAVALIAVGTGGWMLGQWQMERAEQSAAMASAARPDVAMNQGAVPAGDTAAQQGGMMPPAAEPPRDATATAGTGSSAVDLPEAPTGAVQAGAATPATGVPAATQPSSTTTPVGDAGSSNAANAGAATANVAAAAPAAPARQTAVAKRASPAAPPPQRTAARGPASPREACGERTQFALYRCMQVQCAMSSWSQHAQCKRLRERDEVN